MSQLFARVIVSFSIVASSQVFGFEYGRLERAKSIKKRDTATDSRDNDRQGSRGEVVEVGEPWGPERGLGVSYQG